ncbi:MAG: recombinase family protein [Planctomycetaceae bacterium]|nr:recombinase family protein [Planctomycetaceae bacterium]
MKRPTPPASKVVRCAIYTRKSTEEGLQQEFNTLDAQRESGESFIAAQKHEGWVCLPARYDDGGFTGGNLDRPAVTRLMADIEAGKVDCVVVYKVDRLSRSLMDFARMMQIFENHNVSFVSVTQQFNTTHSMGRLTLNILLSFAQFEREIISERTRDKIAAARRKGKFAGGKPILGYDLLSSPAGPKLIVNEAEAEQVRSIFRLYLQQESLVPTVRELNQRRWTTKLWTTKAGRQMGGRVWGKTDLFHLLTNVTVLGKVRHHAEVHAGEHQGIVDPALWQQVQALLKRNGRSGGALVRNKYGALLKGILNCTCCNCAMFHTYSQQKQKRYRYYVCTKAQKRGWDTCASRSIPAGEIEQFVVNQIRRIGSDPAVVRQTLAQLRAQAKQAVADLEAEQRRLQKQLARDATAIERLSSRPTGSAGTELAAAQQHCTAAEQQLTEIVQQIGAALEQTIDESLAVDALRQFDPVWQALTPYEQARLIRLLVERVDYDGKAGTISLRFRIAGLAQFAAELKEAA